MRYIKPTRAQCRERHRAKMLRKAEARFNRLLWKQPQGRIQAGRPSLLDRREIDMGERG